MAGRQMGWLDHVAELRRRLIWIIVTFVVAAVVAFAYSRPMVAFIVEPAKRALADGRSLVFLSPGEAFWVHFQVSVAAAFVVIVPVIFYHLGAFIFPGLTRSERKWVLVTVPPVIVLFAGGLLFAYFMVVPVIYRFFLAFSSSALTPMISVGSYISFVVGFVLPFGVVFELPVLIALLTGIGLVTPRFLSKYRKYTILIIFVAAALLTPPDPFSQCLMALPMVALYEVSLIISKVIHRRKQRARARLMAELESD